MKHGERGALFLVDKPTGPTSHDVVQRLRRWTGTRRVGHGGTLDPLATGLLPVFVGPATRLNEYVSEHQKAYEATVRLGVSTDTDDAQGKVVATAEVPPLTPKEIEAALEPFRGVVEQVPPVYSAVKVGGVVAHRAARRGEPLTLEPRTVTVHELTSLGWDSPLLRLRMTVSTGTYVRAIARDIGAALGCGAHVTAMRRVRVGPITVEQAHPLERLAAAFAEDRGWDCAVSPIVLFPDWPALRLAEMQRLRVQRGQAVRDRAAVRDARALVVDDEDHVVAVMRSRASEPGRWQPEKVLRPL